MSLSIVRHLPLHMLGLGSSVLVRLVCGGSWASMIAWLLQSIPVRFGVSDGTGRGLWGWLPSSLPAVTSTVIVHRAASRGRCGHCRGSSHSNSIRTAAVAMAADRVGGLGHRRVGCDDRCSSRWQGRADVMLMPGGTWMPTIHDLIVALLALR